MKKNAIVLDRRRKKKSFLYAQIAGLIRGEIEKGVYKPGDRLESMDDLTAKFGVNKITVCKAIRELASEGIVRSVPASGTFVSENLFAKLERKRNGNGGKIRTAGIISRVMVPNNTGMYHLGLLDSIRHELSAEHMNLMMLPSHNVEPQEKLLNIVSESGIDALICIGPFINSLLRKISDRGIPSVLVDHVVPGLRMDAVCQDNFGGAYQSVSRMIEFGHRKIAVVAGLEEQLVSKERLDGALSAAEDAGIRKDRILVFNGGFVETGGYETSREILRLKPMPTAVFYMNDEMAIGGHRAFSEAGLKIPGDISISGYDDIPLAANPIVNLDTVKSPVLDMGKVVVSKLKSAFKERKETFEIIRITNSTIIRGSVAAPGKR